ncbi:hypothetical protein [Marinobacter nauticus]|uniref:hypothetical protein n=1 Tax=Marinobacter nauticus TaxID=2743 RepID=UPI0037364500
MTELLQDTVFSDTAFRAMEIGPLPKAPKERSRIGEEIQPVGTYAGIIPYLGTIQDVEVLQEHEKAGPEFESKDWWWDHQRDPDPVLGPPRVGKIRLLTLTPY